uniref:Uncharacterized protein n=1 Tax=Glossina pallidipes TaxID=7398 RepID=A0A1B0AE66_GLOPL
MSSSSIHQPLLFNNNHASHVEILIPHPPNNSFHCSLFTVRLLLNSCSNVRGEPRNEKSKEGKPLHFPIMKQSLANVAGAVGAGLQLSAATASSTSYAIHTLFTYLCTLNNVAFVLNLNAKSAISRKQYVLQAIWKILNVFKSYLNSIAILDSKAHVLQQHVKMNFLKDIELN